MSCGDVPFDYLEALVIMWCVPLLYVPGNHDPDVRSGFRPIGAVGTGGPPSGGGRGPGGCTLIDGSIADVKGVRFAGLGGCLRYRSGPNQYSERVMRLRSRTLAGRLATRRIIDGRGLDVLVTHAPPRGCGDEEDAPHRGFGALHHLVAKTSPRLLLHGHIHPYGRSLPDRKLGATQVINAVPFRLVTLEPTSGRLGDRGERDDRLGDRGGTVQ